MNLKRLAIILFLVIGFILGGITSVQAANSSDINQLLKKKYCQTFLWKTCDLSQADLRGVVLPEVKLSRANLRGADLQNAVLKYADLSGADLRGAKLNKAKLLGFNISRANLNGQYLRQPGYWNPDLT